MLFQEVDWSQLRAAGRSRTEVVWQHHWLPLHWLQHSCELNDSCMQQTCSLADHCQSQVQSLLVCLCRSQSKDMLHLKSAACCQPMPWTCRAPFTVTGLAALLAAAYGLWRLPETRRASGAPQPVCDLKALAHQWSPKQLLAFR